MAFLPQAIKAVRTRDTSSLSLAMYVIFTLGVGLWLAYGILKQDVAIIAANVVTFVFAFLILCIKLINELKPAAPYGTPATTKENPEEPG
ncbi:MAG TPA: SemiSWEET transporter [Gammaproteobacteria bacterium]